MLHTPVLGKAGVTSVVTVTEQSLHTCCVMNESELLKGVTA